MADSATMGIINMQFVGSAEQATKAIKNLQGGLNGLKKVLHTMGTLAFVGTLKSIGNTIYGLMEKQNAYNKTMDNLRRIMGENADEAENFVSKMESILGIDSKQVADTMGTFQRLGQSFGISSDEAYKMSKNLSQLAADMTAVQDLSYEEAAQKLRSGFVGELEPMRAFGVALDKVTLQQTLYKNGIDRTYDSLNRAQKTELIYYQIMTQTASIQRRIAEQAVTPAVAFNMVRTSMEQLARAVGSIFIPIFMKLIPVIMAVTQVLTDLAQKIANFLKIKLDTKTNAISSSLPSISSGLEDISDDIDDVGGSAKKTTRELQKMLMPFDELNNVNFEGAGTSGSGGKGIGGLGDAGSLGLELPEYDLLGGLENQFKEQIDNIVKWLQINLPKVVDVITGILGITGHNKIAGWIELITGIGEIIDAIRRWQTEGLNWDNAMEAVHGIGRIMKAIAFFTGNIKLGIAGLAIEWVADLIRELARCWDEIQQGNWENVDKTTLVLGVIGGLTLIGMGIFEAYKIFNKFKKAKDMKKSTDAIEEATKNVDASVGKLSPKLTSLAKNLGMGIVIIGEVIIAAGLIVLAIWGLGLAFQQIVEAWKPVLDNGDILLPALVLGTAILAAIGLTTKMLGETGSELAMNMGIGTLILLEVEAATALFVGGIWAIGWGLGKVLESWTPVLANGDLVLASIITGTAILVAIAAATALLGLATTATGGLLPLAIGIGTAMLIELGIATGLFIVEIWAIGVGLNQIATAWQPVLANGEMIAQAILTGTALLIAIGSASALLGVASVASVGLLPLAIAAGTLMLVQLAAATILFIESLSKVARELTQNLAPALSKMNSKLPELNDNLHRYINFMKVFGGYMVEFTKASAVAGFSNAVKTVISWFTGSPISNFANDVYKNYREIVNLNNKLNQANPELALALNLLMTYFNFLEALDAITGQNKNFHLASNMFVNMKEVGKNLVLGFVDGIRAESWNLYSTINSVIRDNLDGSTAYYYGLSFGYNIARGIGDAMRNSYYPTLISSMKSNYGAMSISFRAYEDGGYPENGQLFMARENGPELVGNIGNRTAVANNDQIVESLIAGVYQGTSRAFQENQSNNNVTPYIDVRIGDDKLYSGYAKYKNSQSNKYGVAF